MREQCLGLVTAHLENDSVRQRAEEPGQQGRLTSPGLALHIDHLRTALPGGSKPLAEDAQLALPTDETDWGIHQASLKTLLTQRVLAARISRIE